MLLFTIYSYRDRVPLGFVCGYPVGNGGELYGGSMFIKSAATDTLQGKAIHAVNIRLGEGRWNGRETIGIPVCKKKYSPFKFEIVRDAHGRAKVTVERMFGCACHSALRKATIEQHGTRNGWEPFGQWSMRKALERARRETWRLNNEEGETSSDPSSSDDEKTLTICHYGNCTWKSKEKFDDVSLELKSKNEERDEESSIYARYYPSRTL